MYKLCRYNYLIKDDQGCNLSSFCIHCYLRKHELPALMKSFSFITLTKFLVIIWIINLLTIMMHFLTIETCSFIWTPGSMTGHFSPLPLPWTITRVATLQARPRAAVRMSIRFSLAVFHSSPFAGFMVQRIMSLTRSMTMMHSFPIISSNSSMELLMLIFSRTNPAIKHISFWRWSIWLNCPKIFPVLQTLISIPLSITIWVYITIWIIPASTLSFRPLAKAVTRLKWASFCIIMGGIRILVSLKILFSAKSNLSENV